MNQPLEIERRFLIRYPDDSLLRAMGGIDSTITQTYLSAPKGVTLRLRQRTEQGKTVYTRTEKRRLTDMTRVEVEKSLTEAEYTAGLADADPALRPILKTRWRIPYEGRTLEVDLFPFWQRQAILEIELEREDAPFSIPPSLTVLREITGDRAYSNRSLAEKIPPEFE